MNDDLELTGDVAKSLCPITVAMFQNLALKSSHVQNIFVHYSSAVLFYCMVLDFGKLLAPLDPDICAICSV